MRNWRKPSEDRKTPGAISLEPPPNHLSAERKATRGHAFESASGKSLPCKIAPRRPGDVAACYADPSLAAEHSSSTGRRRDRKQSCRYRLHRVRGHHSKDLSSICTLTVPDSVASIAEHQSSQSAGSAASPPGSRDMLLSKRRSSSDPVSSNCIFKEGEHCCISDLLCQHLHTMAQLCLRRS
jgi:hypothetical protein